VTADFNPLHEQHNEPTMNIQDSQPEQ